MGGVRSSQGVLMSNDNGLPYRVGDPVRIINPALPESGVCGEVCGYDPEARWYVVELDKGPPWRGRYDAWELANA